MACGTKDTMHEHIKNNAGECVECTIKEATAIVNAASSPAYPNAVRIDIRRRRSPVA